MNDSTAMAITGILALTILETAAMVKGIDGIVLTTVIAAIVAIATGTIVNKHTATQLNKKHQREILEILR